MQRAERLPVVSDFIENTPETIENLENHLKQTKPVAHPGSGRSVKRPFPVSESEILVRVKDLAFVIHREKIGWAGKSTGLDAIQGYQF